MSLRHAGMMGGMEGMSPRHAAMMADLEETGSNRGEYKGGGEASAHAAGGMRQQQLSTMEGISHHIAAMLEDMESPGQRPSHRVQRRVDDIPEVGRGDRGSIQQVFQVHRLEQLTDEELRALCQADLEALFQFASEGLSLIKKEKSRREAIEKVPAEMVCPITMEVMSDPVIAMDGHTYERSAIVDWLSRRETSPKTNEPLPNKVLVPNHAIRAMIHDHMFKLRGVRFQGVC